MISKVLFSILVFASCRQGVVSKWEILIVVWMMCEELEIWWAYLRGAKGFFRNILSKSRVQEVEVSKLMLLQEFDQWANNGWFMGEALVKT